jgi:hypothetical protein
MERDDDSTYRVIPYSGLKQQQADWLELMRRRHTVHALLEVDVTDTRRAIRAWRASHAAPLSLTAFVIACLARAVDEHRLLHAYRSRRRLVLFDDVDVAIAVEHELRGERIPVPHVIRAANRKGLAEVEREISSARVEPEPQAALRRWMPLWLRVPPRMRRWLIARWLDDPWRRKRLTGTVMVTPVGMFGSGAGWGIPTSAYTLCLTTGGVATRPGLVEDRVEPREHLCLTLSVDHDIVDGAVLSRFAQCLKELIERGGGLREAEPHGFPRHSADGRREHASTPSTASG